MRKLKKNKLTPAKTSKRLRIHAKARSRQFTNLSEIEDADDRSFLMKIVQDAVVNAVNENKALKIPITFYQNGWVVKKMPNGEIQKISEVKNNNRPKRIISKGTVLHVKKQSH